MTDETTTVQWFARHKLATIVATAWVGGTVWVLLLAYAISSPGPVPTEIAGDTGPLLSIRTLGLADLAFLALAVSTTVSILCTFLYRRLVTRPIRELIQWARTSCGNAVSNDQQGDNLTFTQSLELIRASHENCAIELETERNESARVSDVATLCLEHTTKLSQAISTARDSRKAAAESMNALTAAVANIRARAEDGAEAATEAKHEVTTVVEVVSQAMEGVTSAASEMEQGTTAVDRLAEDSKNISGILDVIETVADQTNLLALNASIEAARAGDQGRGFAVVADEVRNLSRQTKNAADDIKGQITRVSRGIGESKSILDRGCDSAEVTVSHAMTAQERVSSVSDAVSRLNELNGMIGAATIEQDHFIDELSGDITDATEALTLFEQLVERIFNDLSALGQPSAPRPPSQGDRTS